MHLAPYDTSDSKLFAATASAIYDVTSPANPNVAPTAAVSGLSGGDWDSLQFTTPGDSFLMMVNGADDMRQYDGTSWLAVNASSTPRSITGVDTSSITQLWNFKNRVFMVQGGTMSAWYLPVDAVGGAATEFPLGGVFTLGGTLLFGATWSLDSGQGLDDVCLFFSSKGEVAVYEGTDPSSASTFALSGVYRIGRPLDKAGWFKAGGDIAVMTDDGIVPVSAAVRQDRSGLKMGAITAPIEDEWSRIIAQRDGLNIRFSVALWHSQTMLIIGLPTDSSMTDQCLVANSRTGAWAEYIGWPARCFAVYDDRLFFGTASGQVVEAEVTGADQGVPYTGVFLPAFEQFNSPSEKEAVHARLVAKSDYDYTFSLFANADYSVDIPAALPSDSFTGLSVWGAGVWGTFAWSGSGGFKQIRTEWQSVGAVGHALSAGVSITSGQTLKPDFEIMNIQMQYTVGRDIA